MIIQTEIENENQSYLDNLIQKWKLSVAIILL